MPVLDNPRHEAFAEAVAEGASAAKAYGAHVAKSHAMRETCMSNASRLMADAKVLLRVQELRGEFAKVLENRPGVRRKTLARYLVAIMETPICEVKQSHALRQEYSEKASRFGTSYRCRMPSKLDAVEKLIKLAGWYEPEKIEHSGGIVGLVAGIMGVTKKPQRS